MSRPTWEDDGSSAAIVNRQPTHPYFGIAAAQFDIDEHDMRIR
jgi:hypothetical protein